MSKRTSRDANIDKSKDYEGVANKMDIEQEEQEEELFSYGDAMELVERQIAYKGYQLHPSLEASYCGYVVYEKCYPKQVGINYPDGFWYWRKTDPSKPKDHTKFISALKEACTELRVEADTKYARKCFVDIYQSFNDRGGDPKSPVAMVAFNRVKHNNVHKVLTITGKVGQHKYVPKLEWFSSELQALDVRTLLTIFPEAEAKMMMLSIGRLAAGSSGSKLAEGTMAHTWRSYSVVVGTEAGMGKSTMLSVYLGNTLEALGYSVARIPLDDTKFGWGRYCVSDFAFIEDLTQQSQKQLIQNNKIKSLVSNEILPVEEKGKPLIDVKSNTLLMGCTNSYNYSDFFGMDAGQLSRLNLLYSYTEHELATEYPELRQEARLKEYWEHIAKDYGVPTNTLMAYMIRRCLDLFLSTCNISIIHDEYLEVGKSKLESTIKELRSLYKINTDVRHAEELTSMAAHLLALSIATNTNYQKYLEKLDNIDYSSNLLVHQLDLFSSTAVLPKELQLASMSNQVKNVVRGKIQDFKRYTNTKTIDESFTAIVKELVAKGTGFMYPSSTLR